MNMAGTTVLMMKRGFNLPLRTLQGSVDSMVTLMDLPLYCPGHSLMSKQAITFLARRHWDVLLAMMRDRSDCSPP
ncbi:hypothetical protein F9222_24525 [Escherichia coli]|nr:hypothetical protein F9222_24525 [Escherichia coli]